MPKNGKKSKASKKAKLPKVKASTLYSSAMPRTGGLSGYLREINDYGHSLANPFKERGCKVPDFLSYPTGTFSVVQRLPVTVNAQGVVGAYFYASPAFEFSSLPTADNQDGPIGLALTTANGTATDIFRQSVGAPAVASDHWAPVIPVETAQEISAVFSSTRIVSAGILLEYAGASMENQGEFASCFIEASKIMEGDPGLADSYYGGGIGFADILKEQVSFMHPVNEGGIGATWHPVSEESFVFRPTDVNVNDYTIINPNMGLADTINALGSQIATVGGDIVDGPLSTNAWSGPLYNHLLISAGVGLVPGALCYATLVVNFEGIPYTNQFSLAAPSPSPVDPIELSMALNDVPTAQVGPADALLQHTPLRASTDGTGNVTMRTVGGLLKRAVAGSKAGMRVAPATGPAAKSTSRKKGKTFFEIITDKILPAALPVLEKYGPALLSSLGSMV